MLPGPPTAASPPRYANTSPALSWGARAFEGAEREELRKLLEQRARPEHLASRPGPGNTKLFYLESWKAIELSNAIFGFDGWYAPLPRTSRPHLVPPHRSSQIVDITPDFLTEGKDGRHRVGMTAIVRVTLKDGTFHEDVRPSPPLAMPTDGLGGIWTRG